MSKASHPAPIFLEPGQGRAYAMGRINATFMADGDETAGRYSVSEWWLEPNTRGVGAHSHEREDEIFFVLAGTMHFLVGDVWREAPQGSFLFVPAGVQHDFENRGAVLAGVLNIFTPGAFEANMPAIVDWFARHPPGNAS